MRNEIGARCSRIPLVLASLIALAGIVPQAAAQTPPLWNNGAPTKCLSSPASIQCPGGAAIAPAVWPTDPQWVAYSWGTTYPDTSTADKHPIDDPRVQDPSNGGTTPQNYVNVS